MKKQCEINKLVAYIIIFCIVIFFLFFSSEQTGMKRTIYYQISSICVFLLLFSFHNNFWQKKRVWMAFLSSAAIVFVYFKIKNILPSTYGELYFKVLLLNGVILCLAATLFVDTSRYIGYIRRLVKEPIFPITTLLAFAVAFFINRDLIIPMIVPFSLVLLTDIPSEDWKRITDALAYASYLVFAVVMMYSYIFYSNSYLEGSERRYLGCFKNIEPQAIFCGMGLLAIIYLIIRSREFEKNRNRMTILFIILGLYPLYSVIKTTSRAVFLGIFTAIFFYAISLVGKNMKQRIVIVASFFAFLIVLFVCAVYVGKTIYIHGNYEVLMQSHVLSRFIGIFDYKTYVPSPYERGSFMFILDYVSSGRVSIWETYIKGLTLFTRTEGEMSPHNFFLHWMTYYGIVAGSLQLLWYIICVYRSVKLFHQNKSLYLMPFLWCMFTLGFWSFAAMTWQMPIMSGFLFLFVIYPLYGGIKIQEE